MKLILHIGTPKTGTTSIQRFFYENKNKLTEEGFYYFTLENIRKIFIEKTLDRNAHLLVAYFIKNHGYYKFQNCKTDNEKEQLKTKIFEDYKNKINKIPKNINTVIISSEHFWQYFQEKKDFLSLKSLLFKTFKEIEIICYIRPQTDTAMSFYSTGLLAGLHGNKNYIDFLDKKLTLNSHLYNYFDTLSLWEEHFGLDKIKLRIFQKNKFKNNDLLDDFSALIDESLLGKLLKPPKQNVSLDHFGHILLQSFNKHFSDIAGLNAFKENKHVEFRKILNRSAKGKLLKIPRDRYDEFQKRFYGSNEELKKKYFPNNKNLFDEENVYNMNNQMNEKHEKLLDEIIEFFAKWVED